MIVGLPKHDVFSAADVFYEPMANSQWLCPL
jgi:hypothetical protein